MRKTNRGFTLIEAMVVVVIIAIMASIGIPSYRQYMMRAQRADGTGALLRMASAQEKFYLQNNRYAGAGEMAPAPPGGLGIPGTEHGYYNLAVAPAAGGLAQGYTATAIVPGGSPQVADTDCVSFTVNEQGVRTALDNGGMDSSAECWR